MCTAQYVALLSVIRLDALFVRPKLYEATDTETQGQRLNDAVMHGSAQLHVQLQQHQACMQLVHDTIIRHK